MNASQSGQTLTYALGVCVNRGDNNTANNNASIRILTGRVATEAGVNDDQSRLLVNSSFTYTQDNGTATLGGSEEYTVVRPVLAVSMRNTSTRDVDAGDLVSYEIVVSHSGSSTASAFDVSVAAAVPADLVIVEVSAGGAVAAGWAVASSERGVQFVVGELRRDAPAEMRTLTFVAAVQDTIRPAQQGVVANVTVQYDSNAGTTAGLYAGRANSTASESEALVVGEPTFLTATLNTSIGSTEGREVTIGELIVLETAVSMIEGTSEVTVVLTLPGSSSESLMALVWSAVKFGSGQNCSGAEAGYVNASQSGQTLTYALGVCVNRGNNNTANSNASIRILTGLVATEAGVNDDQSRLQVNSSFTYTRDNGTAALPGSVEYTVVQPALVISVSGSPLTVKAGSVVRYEVVLEHVSSSTAAAFDVNVTA
ncbi:MAG: hypothetical protein Q7T55_13455, partial [Solirubrobacteraceae bacterium]|nr:hypothetical protein [Solirubrobacteraceae bacterium]